jgi:transcriptional repressor NrdR
LRELDPIAYLRFASVYRHYETIDDFILEIERLKAESPGGPPVAHGAMAGRDPASQPLF